MTGWFRCYADNLAPVEADSVLLLLIGLALVCSPLLWSAIWLLLCLRYLIRNYLHLMVRIFQEKPLFVVPRGLPNDSAEDVTFPSTDGLKLRGCYLQAKKPRRGVILFGVEYGANRWSCQSYCDFLLEAGFDVFACEPRNQGDSDVLKGYEPLQWLTDYEVQDMQSALAYLRSRPDADPRGVGFFGISKGGNAGLLTASLDPSIRCCVTDGAFGTYSVLVPYLRRWFRIYNSKHAIHDLIPDWYFGLIGRVGLRQIERARGCRFPDLEPYLRRLRPRPLLMIHGEADSYISPEMARALFSYSRRPNEFWLVPNAKHNHALMVSGEEYRRRVLAFFEEHLALPVFFKPPSIPPRQTRSSEPAVCQTQASSAER